MKNARVFTAIYPVAAKALRSLDSPLKSKAIKKIKGPAEGPACQAIDHMYYIKLDRNYRLVFCHLNAEEAAVAYICKHKDFDKLHLSKTDHKPIPLAEAIPEHFGQQPAAADPIPEQADHKPEAGVGTLDTELMPLMYELQALLKRRDASVKNEAFTEATFVAQSTQQDFSKDIEIRLEKLNESIEDRHKEIHQDFSKVRKERRDDHLEFNNKLNELEKQQSDQQAKVSSQLAAMSQRLDESDQAGKALVQSIMDSVDQLQSSNAAAQQATIDQHAALVRQVQDGDRRMVAVEKTMQSLQQALIQQQQQEREAKALVQTLHDEIAALKRALHDRERRQSEEKDATIREVKEIKSRLGVLTNFTVNAIRRRRFRWFQRLRGMLMG